MRPLSRRCFESLRMIVHQVFQSWIVGWDVGPMRVHGDAHEIKLQARVLVSIFQRALAVAYATMVMQVSKIGF